MPQSPENDDEAPDAPKPKRSDSEDPYCGFTNDRDRRYALLALELCRAVTRLALTGFALYMLHAGVAADSVVRVLKALH